MHKTVSWDLVADCDRDGQQGHRMCSVKIDPGSGGAGDVDTLQDLVVCGEQ